MWDEEDTGIASASNANVQYSNHTTKPFNTGFSVGKGRGFGKSMADLKNALPEVGSNNYRTFHNVSDDTWTDAPSQSSSYQNDDCWNDNPSQSSGYQNNDSWKPKSGGGSSWETNNRDTRRNNNDNSWSNKGGGSDNWENNRTNDAWGGKSDNVTRGGGFGSRGGGGRVCHSCSQEGHISKDCPTKRRDRRRITKKEKGAGCYKCGQDGHMARDCPDGDKRGKGCCYNCGDDGHMSRDCPSKNPDERRGKGCYNCGEDGHMSRDCPSKNPDERRGKGCYNCGEDGHMSRDCPSKNPDERRSKGCFNCGEESHMSKDCTNPSTGNNQRGNFSGNSQRGRGCFNCGEEGHMSKDCPNPDKRLGPDGKPRPAPYIPPEPSQNEDELFEAAHTGINFDRYDDIPVDVSGRDPPPPFTNFDQANFCQTIVQNIKRSGYNKPTPVQKYAMPIILKKRDLMACAQTGSGKTAAFLLPMIQEMCLAPDLPNNSAQDVQTPWAVIVAPTRELAIQIYNEAKKFSYSSIVKSEVVYGGTAVGHQSARIKRGCHILVATPGRLLDFVEKGKVSFEELRYLVLDEADRMLDMGFIPSIRKMVDDPSMPRKGKKQTLMFSATFPEEIQKLARDFLEDYLFLTVGIVGAANTDVEQEFFKLERFDKRQKLMDILQEAGANRTLVFVEQKRTADFIASFASQNGIPTTSIHGDRLQREREEALRDFRTGRMPVLIATAVAARGLDIKDVRHVINYDLPQTIDEYVHRIGRTGRVGNLGRATSFYDSSVDQPLARALKGILINAQQVVPDWLTEEASSAVGASQHYGGRGSFGSRDMRNQGRSNRGGRSDAWNNDFTSMNNNNFSSNNDMSQPLCPEDAWD